MRTGETLADLAEILGETRRACVARELTKTYEEFVRGTLGELRDRYAQDRPLGEITLVVGGADPDADALAFTDARIAEEALALLAEGRSARDVADTLAARSGRPRREIYALVLATKPR